MYIYLKLVGMVYFTTKIKEQAWSFMVNITMKSNKKEPNVEKNTISFRSR